jgi:hypothetical protein
LEGELEIQLRNWKKEAVETRVVELSNRWADWKVDTKIQEFRKTAAQTTGFRASLKSAEEKSIQYRVRYRRRTAPEHP